MRLRKYLLVIVAAMFSITCLAQQQPMFTQYMFNALVINPAYAGSPEAFTATALLRKQWVGIQDAPQTQTISAHSPLDNLFPRRRPGSKVSLGLTLFNDRIAITDQTGMFVAYAYRLRVSSNAHLSMGLQAGFSQFRIRYSELSLDDPSFLLGDITDWVPNFGTGVYYHTPRFYAGFSNPHFLHKNRDQEQASIALTPQYFLTTGYVFDLSRPVKLKPNILVKSIQGNPLQVDVNCNVFLNNVVELGVSWRSFESVAGIVRLDLNERFSIGYGYDFPSGSELSRLSNGSHEMMVRYRAPVKKFKTINPRYF